MGRLFSASSPGARSRGMLMAMATIALRQGCGVCGQSIDKRRSKTTKRRGPLGFGHQQPNTPDDDQPPTYEGTVLYSIPLTIPRNHAHACSGRCKRASGQAGKWASGHARIASSKCMRGRTPPSSRLLISSVILLCHLPSAICLLPHPHRLTRVYFRRRLAAGSYP
ncbi:hypothetical protein F4780DRAFT_443183 [Xylariomycetidae sp. FL0641]|nr:hypothetical protein F4780DRAFT_443183 [Xylariomycetidae sp. FL0641]